MIDRGETPDDLLSALLLARDSEGGAGLSEHEVAANVLTFIIAGHETTARALGWALHLLSRSPDVQAKVQAEADAFDLQTPDWAQAMPWSRAVFDEAMRLFPPAPTTLRVALGPDVICGKPIEAGTLVLIAPYIIHRHTALWEDPEAFRPERFLPGARETIDRFAYIPFSGGPRICIGAAFAIQEAMIALAVIMRTVTVAPADAEEPMPSHRITLRAKHGIRLKVVRR
jgi:cytochrome P450